jgi:uncharacterized coiled-coil DUF342 family protein
MSEEVVIQRREPSPRLAAFRYERKLMLDVRREIGQLQKRAAFAEARARSTRCDADTVITEIQEIRRCLMATYDRVDELMRGRESVGPSDDCRKALMHISTRLASIPA